MIGALRTDAIQCLRVSGFRALPFKRKALPGVYMPSPKLRTSRRVWYGAIAFAIAIHVLVFLAIRPEYFRVFKAVPPPGEETDEIRFPSFDRPFHLIPLAPEPEPRPRPEEHPAEKKAVEAQNELTTSLEEYELGQPQIDVLPARGGSGGKHGPRNATVEPKPLYIPWPKYPSGLRSIPPGGVELLLLINERGEVDDIKITHRLPLEELNTIAVQAARRIRFTPGLTNGVRTSMWVRLTIGFQPR
jgi:TonB family protein